MSPTSATSNTRPNPTMATTARPTRFGDFGAAPGRHNSDAGPSSNAALGQAYGNGGTWQTSSVFWGNNAIGSGLTTTQRDASRSRAVENDTFAEAPSGSGALAASSEADPWGGRASGPWNPPDNTSPTMQTSQNGTTSPTRLRGSISAAAGTTQTLLEIQNPYSQGRQTIGQGPSYSRPPPKSSLDPSSGSFKFARKPSIGFSDDKENSTTQFSNAEPSYDLESASRPYRVDQRGSQNAGFLNISGTASRETSIPPSRTSETNLSAMANGPALRNGVPSFGSFTHTPSNSIHSQRPSFSALPGTFPSQTNASRISLQTETDLRDSFAGFGFGGEEQTGTPQTTHSVTAGFSPSHRAPSQQGYQANGSGVWSDISNVPRNMSYSDNYTSSPFPEQVYLNRQQRFSDRGSTSPAGSDHRRALSSPRFYSVGGTPPAGSDQIYRPGSRDPRIPQVTNELERRLQSIHFAQQQAYLFPAQYQVQYGNPAYEYQQPTNFRQGPSSYFPVPITPFGPTQIVPTRPAKDQDVGIGVRSALLEEFRSSHSKSNKRYELKDIYGHVVEFSGDQNGSRFIQQKLETANSDEKEQIFREIQPNTLQLTTDVFGNYVIQKLFEHGNQVQKRVLAEQMKNHVVELSMQTYGCRVVQKALEHVLVEQQAELVKELQVDVLKCVKDQNGNHVVQKAIERVPTEHIRFIIDAFHGQVHSLATHPYGCRVIQRILEYCAPADQASVLEELHACASTLITDQYGNYVTQHVIEHGKPEDRAKVIKIVTAQLLTLSKHKFASNVVEKSIQFGTTEQRQAIVSQLTALHSDGSSPLQLMMKDQYGNYVIQKLLGQLNGAERDTFIEDMKPQLLALKKYNCGKQITAIEKLIFVGTPTYTSVTAPATNNTHPSTQPIEITSSAAPTPMLTNGQNSPQSSSLPSTNVSTIEEPAEVATTTGKATEEMGTKGKAFPVVVIDSA